MVLVQAVAGVTGVLLIATPSGAPRPAGISALRTDRERVLYSGAGPSPAPDPSARTETGSPGVDTAAGRSAGSGAIHPGVATRVRAVRATHRRGSATAGAGQPTSPVLLPPFSTGANVTGCFPPGPQCSTEAASRPGDGSSALRVAVTSPGGGVAPGAGSAQGYSGIVAELPLAAPAHRAVITAVVEVARGDVGHEVGPLGLPTFTSRAQIVLQEVAVHSVCGGWGCFKTALAPLASLDDGVAPGIGSRTGGERRLRLMLANPSGLMPAGVVYVTVQIYARAELGSMSPSGESPDVGTVHADAAVRVERIEATVT